MARFKQKGSTMKATIASALIALSGLCSAQDTPDWWPPSLVADSVRAGDSFIYERPLAQFNDPLSGSPTALVAVRCVRSGMWWRVPMRHESYLCGSAGDTMAVSLVLP